MRSNVKHSGAELPDCCAASELPPFSSHAHLSLSPNTSLPLPTPFSCPLLLLSSAPLPAFLSAAHLSFSTHPHPTSPLCQFYTLIYPSLTLHLYQCILQSSTIHPWFPLSPLLVTHLFHFASSLLLSSPLVSSAASVILFFWTFLLSFERWGQTRGQPFCKE